ncbi:LptF/LptG family permease [Flavobacteriaceae bacterium YJPT1-3]|nr:LptF/LptG family permease [Flavobacteriaceae bacterium YJPT1-3]
MFIFVLQTVWLFIKDLAGKDLDFIVIVKFLMYYSPRLVTLVLPLSILLTSIMTFGNFAENYEFAAMKSSGISLQRAMKSLTIFILILSGLSFLFANYVIPAAEVKSLNLRKNITQVKPAMVIAKGQYNSIGDDFTIKIEDKYGENDEFLKDVIIYKKDPNRSGNFTVIKAKEGELEGSTNENILSLKLKNGNYYNEIYQKDYMKRQRRPFVKSQFEEYIINIDLTEFNNIDLEEEKFNNSYAMMNIVELDSTLGKLSEEYNDYIVRTGDQVNNQLDLTSIDSLALNVKAADSTNADILENFTINEKSQIIDYARNKIKTNISTAQAKKKEHFNKVRILNKFEISLHEKYVLAFGCIILFFVGAPLGAIIRKGGLGLPIVVGVVLFLTYHFIGIFAKNSAENGSISAFLATWLSTLIILPLGIYLTYRATTDQGLFDIDSFLDPLRRFFQKLGPGRANKSH